MRHLTKKAGAFLATMLLPVTVAYAGEGKEFMLIIWFLGVVLVDLGYALALYLIARRTDARSFKSYLFGWVTVTAIAILLQWAVLNSGGISTSLKEMFGQEHSWFFWGHYLFSLSGDLATKQAKRKYRFDAGSHNEAVEMLRQAQHDVLFPSC